MTANDRQRVLLIGGAGFAGTALAAALRNRGCSVTVADRVAAAGVTPLELSDPGSIAKVVADAAPDLIFHLAAISTVAESWRDPELTFTVNTLGPLRTFEAVRRTANGARFVFIGSGEEYGVKCDPENPFSEDQPCRPANPYAAAKLAAGTTLAMQAARCGVDFVHLRPFNHYGPHQRTGFMVADFCRQIVLAERGETPPVIKVGNLDARRDFLFIDDIISAYLRIAEIRELPGRLYNLCSGNAVTVKSMLEMLVSLSDKKLEIVVDPEKFRPLDIPLLQASNALAKRDLGWQPVVPHIEGLTRTLTFWRDAPIRSGI